MFKFLVETMQDGNYVCRISDELRLSIELTCMIDRDYEPDWSFMMSESLDEFIKWTKSNCDDEVQDRRITFRREHRIGKFIQRVVYNTMRQPLQKVMFKLIDKHVRIARVLHAVDKALYVVTFMMI